MAELLDKQEPLFDVVDFVVEKIDKIKLREYAIEDFNVAFENTLDSIFDFRDTELDEEEAFKLTEKSLYDYEDLAENVYDYLEELVESCKETQDTYTFVQSAIYYTIKKLGYDNIVDLICSFGSVDKEMLSEFNQQVLNKEDE
jgi:hypothetical protein